MRNGPKMSAEMSRRIFIVIQTEIFTLGVDEPGPFSSMFCQLTTWLYMSREVGAFIQNSDPRHQTVAEGGGPETRLG